MLCWWLTFEDRCPYILQLAHTLQNLAPAPISVIRVNQTDSCRATEKHTLEAFVAACCDQLEGLQDIMSYRVCISC